jgi:hypothetical protein
MFPAAFSEADDKNNLKLHFEMRDTALSFYITTKEYTFIKHIMIKTAIQCAGHFKPEQLL